MKSHSFFCLYFYFVTLIILKCCVHGSEIIIGSLRAIGLCVRKAKKYTVDWQTKNRGYYLWIELFKFDAELPDEWQFQGGKLL